MDSDKTKEQLIAELETATARIRVLENSLNSPHVKNVNANFYPFIIDYLISPVYVKDVNGKYLDCNKLFEDFLQLPRDKIIGKTSYGIIPKERAKKHVEMDKLLYQNGGILSYECEIHRPNGEVIIVWFRKALFSDSTGAPRGIIGEIIDITERKRSEQALIVREQELRTLVENIPDIIIRYDSNLRRIYVNPAWEKASGLSANDVINHPFLRTPQVPNAWYEEYVQNLQSILNTGVPKTIEFTWVNTRDETLFLEYTLLPEYDRTGKTAGVLVVGHDFTERKRAEESLRKTKEALTESCNKLTLAMDLAKLVQWECDLTTQTFYFDDQFYALYGTCAEREGGHLMSAETYAREFVHPDEANLVTEECDRARHSKEKNYFGQVEHRIIRRDGEIRHIVVRYFLVRDANGRPVKTIGANQDITERIQTHKALERARQELELRVEQRTNELRIANERLLELDQLKTAFLTTVSHDLRTPLTSILGFAKLIHRDFDRRFLPLSGGNEALLARGMQINKNLAIIENEGERLTRLINDFLDISKIEAGKMDWRDQVISPILIIERSIQSVSGELDSNPALSITLNAVSDLPPLRVDPDRLVQVFINLLTNAIKFTKEGQIIVKACQATSNHIRFIVQDNGTGIGASDLPKIFDKFYQAHRDNPDAISRKGTGLGLAICKDIIEHYGGNITVESQIGHGSTFIVEIPIAKTK